MAQTTNPDPYKVLGVSRSASESEIKKAYRKLVTKLHPDRNPGDAEAERRFKEVSAAYEVLGNKEKKALYDEFGDVALNPGFDADKARKFKDAFGGFGGGGGFNGGGFQSAGYPGGFQSAGFDAGGGFQDILSQLFGAGGRAGPRPRRGADLRAEISVDFMTALQGGTRTLRVGSETIEMTIPAGVKDGQKIRLSGLGEEGFQGGPKGSLVVKIHVGKHPVFRREGDDIHRDLPVSVLEALRGGPVGVKTPDGEVELTLPAGARSGKALRLRGLGAPKSGSGRGDLYVHIEVQVPESSPEAIELAEKLEKLYRKPVRDS